MKRTTLDPHSLAITPSSASRMAASSPRRDRASSAGPRCARDRRLRPRGAAAPARARRASRRRRDGAAGHRCRLTEVAAAPGDDLAPRRASSTSRIEDGDLAELVTTISTITGKRFIYGGKVRQHQGQHLRPEEQKVTVGRGVPDVFFSVLETNGLTVIPHGHFLKIVESAGDRHADDAPLRHRAAGARRGSLRHAPLPSRAHRGRRGEHAAHQVQVKEADITVYAAWQLAHLHRHRRPTSGACSSWSKRSMSAARAIRFGSSRFTTRPPPTWRQRINEIFDVKAGALPPRREPRRRARMAGTGDRIARSSPTTAATRSSSSPPSAPTCAFSS